MSNRDRSQSEVAKLNVHLAIRHTVKTLLKNPDELMELIMDENSISECNDKISRLILIHLKMFYNQIQDGIASSSNEVPLFPSAFHFLSAKNKETVRDIIERIEAQKTARSASKKNQSSRSNASYRVPLQKDLHLSYASESGSSKNGVVNNDLIMLSERNSTKEGNGIVLEASASDNSSIFESDDHIQSSSPSIITDQSSMNMAEESNSSRQIEKTNIAELPSDTLSERLIIDGTILVPTKSTKESREIRENEIENTQLSPFLKSERMSYSIPSVPEKQTKYVLGTSSRSSDKSEKITYRYMPPIKSTAEACVGTEEDYLTPSKMDATTDIGVNTVLCGISSNLVETSSSTNTFSDQSIGQIPSAAADILLQSSSVNVITICADGSVATKNSSSVAQKFPSFSEWEPYSKRLGVKSFSIPPSIETPKTSLPATENKESENEEEIERISVLNSSRHTISEDSNNTLARISPLPI